MSNWLAWELRKNSSLPASLFGHSGPVWVWTLKSHFPEPNLSSTIVHFGSTQLVVGAQVCQLRSTFNHLILGLLFIKLASHLAPNLSGATLKTCPP